MTEQVRAMALADRGIVAVAGPDRVSFLQGLVTNDVAALAPDRALYAGLLSPQGKLICDFFLVESGERILIDVAAEAAADLARRLRLYKLRAAVSIEDLSAELGVAALIGPGAIAALDLAEAEGAARAEPPGAAFVDPRRAALGVRIIAPRDTTADRFGFPAGAPEDYVSHRLELGIAEGAEIGRESCYPLEANFEALNGVDFRKGCYVGQELTARMKHRGGLRKRVLLASGAAPLPPAGTAVRSESQEIGTLLSARQSQGLALLRLDRLAEAKTEALRAGDVPLSISWPSWLPR